MNYITEVVKLEVVFQRTVQLKPRFGGQRYKHIHTIGHFQFLADFTQISTQISRGIVLL
jgi:hypothetical protein